MVFRKQVIGGLLSHYKFLIVVVLGIVLVGVLGDKRLSTSIKSAITIEDLENEIDKYNAQNEHDAKKLKELRQNPKAIEKVARERYFMKTDNEDIFVLSDDEKPVNDDEKTQ